MRVCVLIYKTKLGTLTFPGDEFLARKLDHGKPCMQAWCFLCHQRSSTSQMSSTDLNAAKHWQPYTGKIYVKNNNFPVKKFPIIVYN